AIVANAHVRWLSAGHANAENLVILGRSANPFAFDGYGCFKVRYPLVVVGGIGFEPVQHDKIIRAYEHDMARVVFDAGNVAVTPCGVSSDVIEIGRAGGRLKIAVAAFKIFGAFTEAVRRRAILPPTIDPNGVVIRRTGVANAFVL